MATVDELKSQLDEAKTTRDDLKSRLASAAPADRATIQKQYNAAKKEVGRLEGLYEDAKKAAKTAGDTAAGQKLASERDLGKAQADIRGREDAVRKAAERFRKDPNNDTKYADYQDAMQQLHSRYLFYQARGFDFPRVVEPVRGGGFAEVVQQEAAPAGRTVAPQRATAGMRGEGMGATPAEAPATPTTTPSTTPTAPSTTTTSTTPTTPGAPKKVAKQGKQVPTTEAWIEQFRKDYPAYSDWTTQSVIDYFGQDVIDVLMKTVDPNVEYSDKELLALFKQTRYYNQTTGKQQEFDKARPAVQEQLLSDARRAIVSEYADLDLAESDLVDLSRQVARSGLVGSGLKQAVYQYAFRRPSAAPEMTAPATAQAALQGADADEIRNSLRAYGYKVSDAELQAALTGGMFDGVAVSKDQLLQKAQRIAKVQYGALADAIDAGASVDDVFYNYKQYAAQTLGLDPSQIDYMRDPKWAEAFGTKETGPLSLSEWVTKLKSDSRFGWQYTADANKQAEDVAMSIARAFGKVQ